MKKLCVIGHPVGHSRSPALHNGFAKTLGAEYEYGTVDVTRETLGDFVARARAGEFAGFNVTMPLKEAIIPHLDAIDGAAGACGSVNTVVCREGKLFGYSTDGAGTIAALRAAGIEVAGRSAVILGRGGAAKAAAFALREGGAEVGTLSRAEIHGGELAARIENADVIINATPLGMEGHDDFEDFGWLDAAKEGAGTFDFVYNPENTRLLRRAEERGMWVIGGLRLLMEQAKEAWTLFTGLYVL
jgi:shikimate dehydrogenase